MTTKKPFNVKEIIDTDIDDTNIKVEDFDLFSPISEVLKEFPDYLNNEDIDVGASSVVDVMTTKKPFNVKEIIDTDIDDTNIKVEDEDLFSPISEVLKEFPDYLTNEDIDVGASSVVDVMTTKKPFNVKEIIGTDTDDTNIKVENEDAVLSNKIPK